MKRAIVIVSTLVVLALVAWAGWRMATGDLELIRIVEAGPAQRTGSADGSCTPAEPCEIRLLFATTQRGATALPRGLLERVAREDTAAIRDAFARSGISRVEAGRPNIVFAEPVVLDRPVDGPSDDVDSGDYSDPVGFNQRMLRALPRASRLGGPARRVNIAVVFSGLAGPNGECWANALAGSGYLVIPGCLLRGYASDPKARLGHQFMFLHEAGHIFGAFHNDNGSPQPCSDAARFGKDPNSCAWEQCTGRSCSVDQLRFASDAFCTLVGQYNYDSGPTGDSFCRAHTGGEQGMGWIREYSHPGKCRTPGFEAYDCGDAAHDAASVMAREAWRVSRQRPKRR